VIRHIDAVDLATIYDDVSIVAAATLLDCHYTTITAADGHCQLALTAVMLYYISHMFYAEAITSRLPVMRIKSVALKMFCGIP